MKNKNCLDGLIYITTELKAIFAPSPLLVIFADFKLKTPFQETL